MTKVKTPVVFIIFNRPDTTEIVFREIARVKPSKLLVIADGPRSDRPGEAEKCAETRKITERVDWDCEVLTCFSDTNLGCKKRVASGLDWAFGQVEEAIIIEDDCVPDPTFFTFTDELLEKYRNDHSVMAISGACYLGPEFSSPESYYFSKIPLIWGWASWRRAWKKYDIKMSDWPQYRESEDFNTLFTSSDGRSHFRKQMDRTYSGALDTWDHQWTYAAWKSGGVTIVPTQNLIRNIGFGIDATHTHFYDPAFDPPVLPMKFPLIHPQDPRRVRSDLDAIWFKKHYSTASKVIRRLKTWKNRFLSPGV